MPANTQPIFGLVPVNGLPVTISTANTARDGSGTLYTVYTAPANGGRVNSVAFVNSSSAVGASVLKVMRVWITDAAGANAKLWGEVLLPLITSSNTVIGAAARFVGSFPAILKSGQLVRVSQSLCATSADNTDATAECVDY